MSKQCVWCGATLDVDDRVCTKCLSAQPPAPPNATPSGPPQPGYGYDYGYGYGPPPTGSSPSTTGRAIAIVIGASVAAIVAVALLCILAITFLGQKSSSKFVAVGPTVSSSPTASSTSVTDRSYPQEVRTSS